MSKSFSEPKACWHEFTLLILVVLFILFYLISPKSPVQSSCTSTTLLTLATGYLVHQIQTGNYFL